MSPSPADHSVSQAFEKTMVVAGACGPDSWDAIEQSLLEARGRFLSALDGEIEALRALKARCIRIVSSRHEVFPESHVPPNVLPMGNRAPAAADGLPLEATLDPALERATIEELNASLAAAFRQISSK